MDIIIRFLSIVKKVNGLLVKVRQHLIIETV